MGSCDLLLTTGPPTYSQEWLMLHCSVHAVCAALLMQPLPNYFGLLFNFGTVMIPY